MISNVSVLEAEFCAVTEKAGSGVEPTMFGNMPATPNSAAVAMKTPEAPQAAQVLPARRNNGAATSPTTAKSGRIRNIGRVNRFCQSLVYTQVRAKKATAATRAANQSFRARLLARSCNSPRDFTVSHS